jgi:hypothetical protein
MCKNMGGHKEKRDKGDLGKPVFYGAVYNKGGNHNVGVMEDTLISKKEARERARLQREANHAAAASTSRTPILGAKTQGGLKRILNGQRKASPISWEVSNLIRSLESTPRAGSGPGLEQGAPGIQAWLI